MGGSTFLITYNDKRQNNLNQLVLSIPIHVDRAFCYLGCGLEYVLLLVASHFFLLALSNVNHQNSLNKVIEDWFMSQPEQAEENRKEG